TLSPPVVSCSSMRSFSFPGYAYSYVHILSLHDALPISPVDAERIGPLEQRVVHVGHVLDVGHLDVGVEPGPHEDVVGDVGGGVRSEEHTSELQSRFDVVCRLLLE